MIDSYGLVFGVFAAIWFRAALMPGEEMPHESLNVSELLVNAVRLQVGVVQPAAVSAAVILAHTSDSNCDSEVPASRVKLKARAEKIDQFLHHLRSSLSGNKQLGTQVSEFIDWAKRYSDRMRKACTAGEINKALVNAELFKPSTTVAR